MKFHFSSTFPACFLQPVSTLVAERPKSPKVQQAAAGGGKGKVRGKKGKGGKSKPEVPEETDPRKLELLNWVKEPHISLIYRGGKKHTPIRYT